MFFRRDVAQHRRAIHSDHRGANRAGDVVVAGSDIGDERAERVKRRFVAQLHFLFHLHFDLVHRNVAGAFDHYLHVVLPGFLGEFAKHSQFRELRFVAGVGNRAGTQAIAERKTDVVLFHNFADVVKAFVEKIFFFVMIHPLRHDAAAAADDSGDAFAHERNEFAQNAGVNGHVVHALLGLFFDDFQH